LSIYHSRWDLWSTKSKCRERIWGILNFLAQITLKKLNEFTESVLLFIHHLAENAWIQVRPLMILKLLLIIKWQFNDWCFDLIVHDYAGTFRVVCCCCVVFCWSSLYGSIT
jgi:hypothetical protein